MKKCYGSKSRREKEKKEFYEKISLREETKEIYQIISEVKKEIEYEKQRTAKLFIESNTKQALLKDYIAFINKRIFSGSSSIDSNIENKDDINKKTKEIEDKAYDIEKAIEELQKKMQIVIRYTKSEMDHQITQKFQDAEKRQRTKMLRKVEEGNSIIRELNHTRLELEQKKIEFEEMNTKCDILKQQCEKLKIRRNDLESDYKNLQKKLEEIQKENEDLKVKYKTNMSKNSEQEEQNEEENSETKELKKSNNEIKIEESKDEINDETQNKKNNNNEYYPKDLILILKESIKAFHKDTNELIIRITDEKKEKNEASQLLQKSIDDINSEIKVLTRTSMLPNINQSKQSKQNKQNNYLTYGYNNNINSLNADKVSKLENKLLVLTYIYDNVFQDTKNKNLYFINKESSGYSKNCFKNKTSKNFYKTFY